METEKKRLTANKNGKDRNGIQIRKVEECQVEMSMTRDRARGRLLVISSLLVVSDVAGP